MTIQFLRPASSRRDALFADPLLRRDLLLVALAWDHLLDTKPGEVIQLSTVARMAGLPYRAVLDLLVSDAPRYQPPPTPELCQYVGPRGGRCNRREARSHALRDPDDGTITWVSACYDPTHTAWAQRRAQLHGEALGTRTPPKPAYNTRSRIAHHFEDDFDFPTLWVMLTTAKANRWKTARVGSFEIPLQVNQEAIYDVTRDPGRGGAPAIQRPRLRIVS
jgi:hypothetical protein